MRGGKDGSGIISGGERQNFRFLRIEAYTKGKTKCFEGLDKPWEVVVHKEEKSVVDIRQGCSEGAVAVITGLTGVEAMCCPLKELFVDGLEQLMQDKAGQNRGKWVALRKAFLLEKVVGGAVRTGEETPIGRTIH